MTTLIIRKNTDGVITGRCDARCYKAKSKKCKCVCGGINHGKGINAAIFATWLKGDCLKSLYKSGDILIKQGQLQIF